MTEETRGLIGKEELALMKKSAILINTARGPVVDSTALANALQTGRSQVPLWMFLRQSLRWRLTILFCR